VNKLACVVLGLVLTTAPAADTPKLFDVETKSDIRYYSGDGAHKTKHLLDLYLPKGQKDFPVLFFVHGGAWRTGDKNYFGVYSNIGKFFAQRGIGTVVINYRLTPEVQHPEHIKDVARAFAWTVKNIAGHGGKVDRLFVSGHSAGGHLVALLATDASYLKAEGVETTAIRGVLPISGVYQIPAYALTRVFGTDREVARKASPLEHVRAGLPPFLILCADKDLSACGKAPSERFCKALVGKDCKAEFKEIEGSTHIKILMSATRPDDPVSEALLTFIRAHSR
jgi:acetyl esterase/lipase